jgi:hypothetical protein
MSKVKCFNCGKLGHITPTCPEKEKEQGANAHDSEIKAKVFASWEDGWEDEEVGTYVTYHVCNRISYHHKFQEYDIQLDNQADVSIVHPWLLREVMQVDQPVTMKGIGGKQLV